MAKLKLIIVESLDNPNTKLTHYKQLLLRLLLQLKFLSVRGASHHPALMGHCQTISHMFYSLIYPVDEGNEV